MPKQPTNKKYYTIGEVAELFEVSTSLIRFWEGEFDFLQPVKNQRGDRRFTQKNINQLKIIHHLVKERGFTLEGARREISNNKERIAKKFEAIEHLNDIRNLLEQLKTKV